MTVERRTAWDRFVDRVYHWIDKRGRIPWWAKLVWPYAHWCPEMDGLLILDNTYDCFCGWCDPRWPS